MAQCPAYQGPICSPVLHAGRALRRPVQARRPAVGAVDAALRRLLPPRMWPQLDAGLAQYLLLMGCWCPAWRCCWRGLRAGRARRWATQAAALAPMLREGFIAAYLLLLIVAGIVAWWLVLAQQSRLAAQEESNRQTEALFREIESHRRTDEAAADRRPKQQRADAANGAKSRYITTISHELRTPLNSILGYAQLLEEDDAMPPHRRQAVSVIRRGGDHLLSLIEGTLDIARIESGKLTLEVRPMRFADGMAEIARLFELQAAGRGILSASSSTDGAAGGGARRREAAAPDPHQPAGQRGEVHRARPGHAEGHAPARDGALRDQRHRPGHEADELERCSSPSSAARPPAACRPAAPAWA
jgi:signal transduction histidine kinase